MVVLTRKDIIKQMSKPIILAVVEDTESVVEHVVDTSADEHTEAATTTETAHAPEASEGISALGLDPFAIGAQALTFLLLFWIVKKFALSGIVKNLDKRHEDINRGLHLTAELDKQKAELDERFDSVLQAARKDADLIIADAHKESSSIIQAAEESANRRSEEILRTAEGKIERDIANARAALKTEVASLVTEAAEAVLSQKLDANADRKLVENYLKEAMK